MYMYCICICLLLGKMNQCPAYLGIIINNRLDLEELCRYDLLILCPAEFNVSFSIQRQYPTPSIVTFDVQLYDTTKNYSIFLTNFVVGEPTLTSVNRILDENIAERESTVVVAIMLSSSLTFVVFFAFYLYIEFFKKRYWSHLHFRKSTSYFSSGSSFGFQVFIAVAFVIVRLAYGLLFTFSVLAWLFALLRKPDIVQLLALERFQVHQRNISARMFSETEKATRSELFRLCEVMNARLFSCSHYVDDLQCNLSSAMADAQRSPWILARNSSISAAMHRRTRIQADRYSDSFFSFAEQYKSRASVSVLPLIKRYKEYLDAVFQSGSWFSYPLTLFNLSRHTVSRGQLLLRGEEPFEHFGFFPDFGLFLEIDEIEDVSTWFQQFVRRYSFVLKLFIFRISVI